MTSKQNVSFTLSIGVGTGVSSLPELGVLAQSSLDLALGEAETKWRLNNQMAK